MIKKFILILIFSLLFFNNVNAEDRKNELDKLFFQLKNAKDLSSAQLTERTITKIYIPVLLDSCMNDKGTKDLLTKVITIIKQ